MVARAPLLGLSRKSSHSIAVEADLVWNRNTRMLIVVAIGTDAWALPQAVLQRVLRPQPVVRNPEMPVVSELVG